MKEVKLNINDEQAQAIKDGKLKVALIPADAIEEVDGGNTDPLYVVDGFKMGYPLSVNPNDIESIEVLKDAQAGMSPDGSCSYMGKVDNNGFTIVVVGAAIK